MLKMPKCRNDYTKKQLAAALKECLTVKPLKSITVADITARCGMNRGTFYYHFYDKQELINWIYHMEITEPTRKILAEPPESWSEISIFGLQIMQQNREFYLQAMRLEGQNSLRSYIKSEIETNWSIMVERYKSLCRSQQAAESLTFYASFMANGAWAMLMKWVDTGMRESPENLSQLLDGIGGQSMASILS